jgi:hypothetical protein
VSVQAKAKGLYVQEKIDLLVNYLVVTPFMTIFGKVLAKVSLRARGMPPQLANQHRNRDPVRLPINDTMSPSACQSGQNVSHWFQ